MVYIEINNRLFSSGLKNVRLYQSSIPFSLELSIDTFYATITSAEDLSSYFSTRNLVKVWKDSAKTQLVGTYYITEYDDAASGEYSFGAQSIIGVWNDIAFEGAGYETQTSASQIVQDIFGANSGITFDGTLGSRMLKGFIPAGTKRTALQAIAFAVGAKVVTAGRQGAFITDSYAVKDTFGKNKIFRSGISYAKIKPVTAINVPYYTTEIVEEMYQNFYDEAVKIGDTIWGIVKEGTVTVNNEQAQGEPENVVEIDGQYLISTAEEARARANALLGYYQATNNFQGRLLYSDLQVGDYIGIDATHPTPDFGFVEEANLYYGTSSIVAEVSARVSTAGTAYYITVNGMYNGQIIGSFGGYFVAGTTYSFELDPIINDNVTYYPEERIISGTATGNLTIEAEYYAGITAPRLALTENIVDIFAETPLPHYNDWYVDDVLTFPQAQAGWDLDISQYPAIFAARNTPYEIKVKSTATTTTEGVPSPYSNEIEVYRYAVSYSLTGVTKTYGNTVVTKNTTLRATFSASGGTMPTNIQVLRNGVILGENAYDWIVSGSTGTLYVSASYTTGTISVVIDASWEYPVKQGENLTITQAYNATKSGDTLSIE